MPEWIFIILIGAIGGGLNSIMHHDPMRISTYVTHTGQTRTDYGLLGSLLAGAAAAPLVWVFEHPTVTAATPVGVLFPLAGALITGLGGGRILRSYFMNAKQTSAVNETADILETATEAALDLVNESRESNDDQGKNNVAR